MFAAPGVLPELASQAGGSRQPSRPTTTPFQKVTRPETFTAGIPSRARPLSVAPIDGKHPMNTRRHLLMAITAAALLPLQTLAATDRAARCAETRERLQALRQRMRMGYTARQGRLYRQKIEMLEARRRRLCT